MREIVDKLTSAFFAENTIISFTSQLDEALTRKLQRVQRKVENIKDRFIELNGVFQKISQEFQKNSEKLIEAVQEMENMNSQIIEDLKNRVQVLTRLSTG